MENIFVIYYEISEIHLLICEVNTKQNAVTFYII